MKEELPTNISVELDEDDVRKNLFQTLTAMDLIRNEAVISQWTEEKNDEYLHLTYRLASGLKGLADEVVVKKMEFVLDEMLKDERLIFYDLNQQPYWTKVNRRFCETLDDLILDITQDLFLTTRHKYHLLQGIKYLAILDEDKEDKKKVFSTIIPHQQPVSIDKKQGISQRVLGLLFGSTYKIQDVGGGGVRVFGKFSELEPILNFCKDRGYDFIEFELNNDAFKTFRKVLRENYSLEAQAKGEFDVDKLLVRVDLVEPNKSVEPKNYLENLREATKKDLQGRDSLVWQEDKHFEFGKKLEKQLKEELQNKKMDINTLTNYESVVVFDLFKNDGVTKITATYFRAGQDTTLSLTTKEKIDYEKLIKEDIPKILNSENDIDAKMSEIHNLTKAKYLRYITSLGETTFEDRTLLV